MPHLCLAQNVTLQEAIERAAPKLSEAEFRARLEVERATFDGLLDDDALALLILDELGLNDGAYVTIAGAKGRMEASIRVKVERIEAPRVFERAGRASGRVANVIVGDGTGAARLVLWDRDVDKVEDGTLREGGNLTIVNARVKEDRWGLELHASPWTVLEVEGALDPAKRKLLADVAGEDPTGEKTAPAVIEGPREATLTGRVLSLSPARTSPRPGGGVHFIADMDLDTADGRLRVVLRDEPVRQARAFFAGTSVRVTDCVERTRSTGAEWHTTKTSRVEATDQE